MPIQSMLNPHEVAVLMAGKGRVDRNPRDGHASVWDAQVLEVLAGLVDRDEVVGGARR
jgi:hypothetical protein